MTLTHRTCRATACCRRLGSSPPSSTKYPVIPTERSEWSVSPGHATDLWESSAPSPSGRWAEGGERLTTHNTPENLAKHADADIVINATPAGMYPNNGASPADLSLFPKCRLVLDLIFNPARTALILDAERRGIPYMNGLPMLVAQAAKAFEYFTGGEFEEGAIERITSLISEKTVNIVLVGMPGCGKSTVGKLIADILGRSFFDADDEFTKMHGISPAECIKAFGEDSFRELEHKTLCELGKLSSAVIATGGGAVTREFNYDPLHQNGCIFFIERELSRLARGGRPLSLSTTPEEMYRTRIDSYRRFADVTVVSNEIIQDTANKIISEFKR